MIIDNFQFVDLGLPSGKLWATENVKSENGNEAHYTFDEAVETFGKNLPSKEDWKELFDNSACNWNKERKGYDVVGPNGNSIFLPAAGDRNFAGVYNVGRCGFYWSLSVFDTRRAYSVTFGFDEGCLYPTDVSFCFNEFSVRLVR